MTKHSPLLFALAAIFCLLGQQVAAAKSSAASPSGHQLTQAVELLDGYRGDSSSLERAKAILDGILQKDPGNAPAHREIARYHIMRGHLGYLSFMPGSLEAAEASLKKAIEVDPSYAEAYVLAGHLYRLMKRPIEAKAALSKADALGSRDPWLQNNWADILIDEGRLEEAAQRYKNVVESGTENRRAMVAAFEGLTRYYKRTGSLDEADSIYRKKIAYDPESAWNYGNYANFLLCVRDDFEGALEQANHALQIMNYGAGRRALAAALYRKWADQIMNGDTAGAQMSIADASAIEPGSPLEIVASVCGSGRPLNAVSDAEKRVARSRS
ncbi:tetratricopeptide repeat protein [Arenimonas donghaensis]|uniref:tetratricopeptide repeat protein n=1 Tax=Arenimonas donghaensis TaxID=375061 RepID=UPI001267F35F|nr:hypothetical protein [Arenimonas donghaensis]